MHRATKALGLVLLGAVLGALAAGFLARRLALEWDRDSSYGEALRRTGADAEVLLALEAGRETAARERLERDLLAALTQADELAAHGANVPFGALFAGPALQDVGAALSYVRAHGTDPETSARAERLRTRLCAALSPGSKYRGLCS